MLPTDCLSAVTLRGTIRKDVEERHSSRIQIIASRKDCVDSRIDMYLWVNNLGVRN